MLKFTFLWTLAPIAVAFFFIGIYKNVVSRLAYVKWVNMPGRDGIVHRDTAVRLGFPRVHTMVNEALLQKRIRNRSTFLWIRHLLIFSGFGILFVFDLLIFILGKVLPALTPIHYFANDAGRAMLKVALEFGGALALLGFTLALIHRIVFAAQESKCIELKLIFLLWFVVLTGFLAESFRLVVEPADPFLRYSFIAGPVAQALTALSWPWSSLDTAMWITHVGSALFFIAYLPYSKLVHMFVAPIGRSVTMGQDTAGLKMEKISEAWL